MKRFYKFIFKKKKKNRPLEFLHFNIDFKIIKKL